MITIERSYPVPPSRIWTLWTTADGIESWWAPEGFRTDVSRLELRLGGELVYVMTAVGPDQVAFMSQAGLPLSTEARKTFTELAEPARLAYQSLIDFVPDHEPYQHLTEVDLQPDGDGTRLVMTIEPMHDDVWTERLVAGRTNELDNLARLVAPA